MQDCESVTFLPSVDRSSLDPSLACSDREWRDMASVRMKSPTERFTWVNNHNVKHNGKEWPLELKGLQAASLWSYRKEIDRDGTWALCVQKTLNDLARLNVVVSPNMIQETIVTRQYKDRIKLSIVGKHHGGSNKV